jgi:hypothetical protein|tara:strand:- start:2334 stop:2870 length:537 start_codon:yes stop_codon:yes gene_type:complete
MSPELLKCKEKCNKFFRNQTRYLERREFVNKFNETSFRYFITLPLQNQFLSNLDLSSKFSQFIINLNRKIFTRKELNRNLSLKVLPIIEKNNHIHFLIDSPECKRLEEVDDPEEYIKQKVISLIRKMRLFSLKLLDPTFSKFFKKIKNIDDQFQVINYITKQDKLLTNIDYTNIKLAT